MVSEMYVYYQCICYSSFCVLRKRSVSLLCHMASDLTDRDQIAFSLEVMSNPLELSRNLHICLLDSSVSACIRLYDCLSMCVCTS